MVQGADPAGEGGGGDPAAPGGEQVGPGGAPAGFRRRGHGQGGRVGGPVRGDVGQDESQRGQGTPTRQLWTSFWWRVIKYIHSVTLQRLKFAILWPQYFPLFLHLFSEIFWWRRSPSKFRISFFPSQFYFIFFPHFYKNTRIGIRVVRMCPEMMKCVLNVWSDTLICSRLAALQNWRRTFLLSTFSFLLAAGLLWSHARGPQEENGGEQRQKRPEWQEEEEALLHTLTPKCQNEFKRSRTDWSQQTAALTCCCTFTLQTVQTLQ